MLSAGPVMQSLYGILTAEMIYFSLATVQQKQSLGSSQKFIQIGRMCEKFEKW